MSNSQREEKIIGILKEISYASVEYLSKKLYTSPSSIRRDLRILENLGLIRRTHGGASIISSLPGMEPYSLRLREKKGEKMMIVRKASALIKDGVSIFIDSSTTALNFSSVLTSGKGLTVFTNNMLLANLLADRHITAYCIGGRVSDRNHIVTTGSFVLDMLDDIYVETVFFSSAALSAEGVISDTNENETAIRKKMIAHARQKVFLCPRERFPLLVTYQLACVSDLDYIVSDGSLPDDFINKYPRLSVL